MYKIFLVVPPGLEQIAKKEVAELFPPLRTSSTTNELEYECDLQTIYKLNLLLKVPNRVLVRFGEFEATSFQELFTKTVRLPWKLFFKKDVSVKIRTTCHKSKLYHSDAVTERIHQAIESNLAKKVPLLKGDSEESHGKQQLIIVRLLRDQVSISIDSSGNPLYMRGYREIVSKAPIRENLAASIILASGWTPEFPLIDPFCGSGTIPIEAALIAKNHPPGLYRDFSFENWPEFNQSYWQNMRREYIQNFVDVTTRIQGSDRNIGSIENARKNSEKAGVNRFIEWKNQSISDVKPYGQPGWIITNPPYGLRISSNKDIRNLYAQFGNVLRQKFQGWNVIFLCNSVNLANQTRLKPKSLFSFSNGGINVQAFFTSVD
ncbi:MAG: class I SAM-dependent RNA methyltransferase [Chloroflexi bacterium HGW-Chloroflexi-2]|jgi:putative N6-adenine-specific DNA methylase|nr:MAG: class I SAM-dependent RNA methyltransferase [Chloroflexi bacterium HGW-Chloroflexi-2]